MKHEPVILAISRRVGFGGEGGFGSVMSFQNMRKCEVVYNDVARDVILPVLVFESREQLREYYARRRQEAEEALHHQSTLTRNWLSG